MRHLWAALVVLTLLAVACGEPAIDVSIPSRRGGARHIADRADILVGSQDIESALEALEREHGVDVVVLTYETEQAGCGEAFRAGKAFVDRWDADVAIVAVARPGGFVHSADPEGLCLGVQPRNEADLGRGAREGITEELWPPLIALADWDAVVLQGAERLAEEMGS